MSTNRYPTERERHIAAGRIVPLESRPTLRLLPGEREQFETEAWLTRNAASRLLEEHERAALARAMLAVRRGALS